MTDDDELSRLRETANGAKDEDGQQDGIPQEPDTAMRGDVPPHDETADDSLVARALAKKIGPDDVLKIARSQLGQGEHPPGSNHNKYSEWYGIGDGPWCDMFQGWCDEQAGGDGWLKKAGKYAYTPDHANFYYKNKRWGHTPRVGALVFYDWAGGSKISGIDHIERVESVHSDGTFYTIGGNVSDKVKRTRRSMQYVVGFGYPPYNTNVPAPDPNAWPGRYIKLTSPYQHGADVTWVQKHLNDKAHAGLEVDGEYGPKSQAAVKSYQKEHKLEVDGVVGPNTWKSLAG